MADLVIHPNPLFAVRHLLLDTGQLTAIVGRRIADVVPGQDAAPRWPAVRVNVLQSVVVARRRLTRTSVQVDCYGTTQTQADRIAALVLAALQEAAGHVVPAGPGGEPGAVMGESEDLVRWPSPDETFDPDQPRSLVTGHVFMRPNP